MPAAPPPARCGPAQPLRSGSSSLSVFGFESGRAAFVPRGRDKTGASPALARKAPYSVPRFNWVLVLLESPSALDQLHHSQNYGNHEQHMDEPAEAVRRDYTQQPQHQEYHEDRPQHGYLLTLGWAH